MDHLWLDREMQEEMPILLYQDPQILLRKDDEESRLESTRGNIMMQELFLQALAGYHALLGIEYKRSDYIAKIRGRLVMSTSKLYELGEEMARRRAQEYTFSNAIVRHSLEQRLKNELTGEFDDTTLRDFFHFTDMKSTVWKVQTLAALPRADSVEQLTSSVRTLLEEFADQTMVTYDKSPDVDPNWLIACVVLDESLGNAFTRLYGRGKTPESIMQFIPPKDDYNWSAKARDNGICLQRLDNIVHGERVMSQSLIATSMKLNRGHQSCVRDTFCRQIETAQLPQHHACDGCSVITVDKVQIENAIERVGYGTLQYADDRLVVTNTKQYVAFSHVWSHGLGNPYANGLPQCQLRRLMRYTLDAGCDAFWVDPICVPLGTWKQRALEEMAEVYKRATKVIVLDRDLLRCRGTHSTKRIAITLCDWLTRIWTLQEAVFGDLWIAFADGIVRMQDLFLEDADWMICTHQADLHCRLTDSRGVIGLASNFHARATTVAEDEGVCLAILLGVGLRPDVPGVIQQLSEVEQDLIFAPGARSDRPGMRWCPQSLISVGSRVYAFHQIKVKLSERGILMRKDTLMLGRIAVGEPLLIGDYVVSYRAMDGPTRATIEQCQRRQIEDAALIFERPINTAPVIAVLLSGVGNNAHYECAVFVTPRGPDDQGSEVHGRMLYDHQMWVD